MCLDPNGKDASLLAEKIKEHIAESESRKQRDGRKRSTVNKELAEEDQVARNVAEIEAGPEQGSPANKEKGKKKVILF